MASKISSIVEVTAGKAVSLSAPFTVVSVSNTDISPAVLSFSSPAFSGVVAVAGAVSTTALNAAFPAGKLTTASGRVSVLLSSTAAATAAAAAPAAAAASKKAAVRTPASDDDDEDDDEETPVRPEVKRSKKDAAAAAAPAASPAKVEKAEKAAAKAATPVKAAEKAPAAAIPAKTAEKTERSVPASAPVQVLPGGTQFRDEEIGSGAQIKSGSQVMLRYTGMLPSGKVFDSNMPRGSPLSFTVGAGDVIRGMDLGVLGMRKGGRRRIIIPPAHGYGAAGSPPTIPSNATLIFDVEVVSFK